MKQFFALLVILLQAQHALLTSCLNKRGFRQCSAWKRLGYCKSTSKYSAYMQQNCAKVCGLCARSPTKCADKDARCSGWKSYCNSNNYVKKSCLKSCKRCTVVRKKAKVNGNWGDWSDFSACKDQATKTGTCVTATQTRTRKCDNPRRSNGGRACIGKDKTEKKCCTKCNSGDYTDSDCYKWRKFCSSKTKEGTISTHLSKFLRRNCAIQCGVCSSPLPTNIPPTKISKGGGGDDNCGRSFVTAKVVGGTDSTPHEWPWQVGIWSDGGEYYEEFFCGGTLVKEDIVITAAHCVENRWKDEIKLKFGDHNRGKTAGVLTMKVAAIKMHEGYNTLTVDNDIAVIKLVKKVAYNKKIQPACLPKSNKDVAVKDGKNCYITGWGKTKGGYEGRSAIILQKAKMPIISKENCKKMNAKVTPTAITDSMLCAGPGPGSGVSGCQGDSGGPFVCTNADNRWVFQGAVSWGDKLCRAKEKYTVFARATYLLPWIQKTIKDLE